jgi:4'-phosphopantetheinyl transferase EntD
MSISGLENLINDIQGDLPPWMSFAMSDPSKAQTDPLFPVEEAAVSRAVVKRRNEFAAGRSAARAALVGLNQMPSEIPMAEDRSPVWPNGITGSISHTDAACFAAVARVCEVRTIGVDLEQNEPIDDELISDICLGMELNKFEDRVPMAARRIFSAKEAAYKTQYPLTRTLFGFEALQLCSRNGNNLTFRFTRDIAPFRQNDQIVIRQWVDHGVILSLGFLN